MRSVLVIEDNEHNMYLTRFILENGGYTVIEARSGEEGIRFAETHRPHLILLDIQLPEMDGYAVARQLRINSELNSVPIIAVTSYAMVGDRERVLDAGCTGYIEKPINPDTFITQIREFLDVAGA
ncbi:MAG: response regulator [Leptospiraceae bacterium]|nr:response regulator [Leptospiraceae bacterium]